MPPRPRPAYAADSPKAARRSSSASATPMPTSCSSARLPAFTRTSRDSRSSASRDMVFVANVLKCRPPGNRDPMPDEIEACERHLFRQVELIQPKLVATLGNFATKLLSGKQLGITRVHGQEQEVTLGGRRVLLYPIYHPAAALYTPAMLKALEEDFRRIPELLGRASEPEPEAPQLLAEPAVQLGLF